MATLTKRCAVCTIEVAPTSIFCGRTCRDIGRIIRDVQPLGDEEFTLADQIDLGVEDPVSLQLQGAGRTHRMTVATILAAFTHAEVELDAVIWAAHARGMTDREIGVALEMRTSNVRRRVLAFQARMHGPARVATSVARVS